MICMEDSEDGSEDGSGKKVELSRGTKDGDVYSNKTMGFKFNKPDDWVYMTEAEIASAMNIGMEALAGKNYKDLLKNLDMVYDMMAKDVLTGSNISVGYENLERTFTSSITEKQYADAMKTQLQNVPNVTFTFLDNYDKVKLGDTEFTRFIANTVSYGTSMTQAIYLRKQGTYMTYVIVTLLGDYTVAEAEAMFE